MAYMTDRDRATEDRAGKKAWTIFVLLAVAALAIILFWSMDDDQVAEQATGTEQTASVEGISADPRAYLGQSVTLRGNVGEVHGDRSFRLQGEDARFDEDVIVIDGDGARVERDARVQVSGLVRLFDEREIEADLDIDIDDAQARSYVGEAVVVATSVNVLEGSRARAGD